MWQQLIAFFMAVISFFFNLFGYAVQSKCYVYQNQAYGAEERQILDLYIPKNAEGSTGLLLAIHGGAWIAGDKDGYKDYIKNFAESYNIAAAAINYRYISESVSINDIADDIEAALSKIKNLGEERNIKIDKVLLTGSSAGAHLSMFYAYARADAAPVKPVAVVSYCGPTDLADKNFYYSNDMGNTDFMCLLLSCACGHAFTMDTFEQACPYLEKASPITYVNENTVPTVIAHGAVDTVVPFSNAVALDAKLTQFGVKHDFIIFPNSNHGLDNDPDQLQQTNALLEKYILEYLY